MDENETESKNKDNYESPDDDRLKQKPGKRQEGRKITTREKTSSRDGSVFRWRDKRNEGEER